MRRLFQTTLVFLVILLPAQASPSDASNLKRARSLSLEGMEYAFNFDFANAIIKFDEAITIKSDHPWPYLGRAVIALWNFLLSKSDSSFETFLANSDIASELAEKYLHKYGENADVLTSLGLIHGYRAFAFGRSKSYLRAAWEGKKSFDYFNHALDYNPEAYDAYLGLGIFQYFAAFLPDPLQSLVSILGIKGDSRLGLRKIRIAAEKGTFVKTEAKYYLSQLLPWIEGDFTASEKILKELHQQYPKNTMVDFTLAVWELRRRDVESARDRLINILKANNNTIDGLNPFVHYKLAECYFRLGKYIKMQDYYKLFLQGHNDERYVAIANYRIGLTLELAGERERALIYYRQAVESNRIFGGDAYSARKAQLRLKFRISPSDSLLILAQNTSKKGDYTTAFEYFTKLTQKDDISPDTRAEAFFGLGETLYRKNQFKEAIRIFKLVLKADVDEEQWVLPWAHYMSGLCYRKLGQHSAAKEEFQQVLDFDEYDFQNWIRFRTERELDKFKK